MAVWKSLCFSAAFPSLKYFSADLRICTSFVHAPIITGITISKNNPNLTIGGLRFIDLKEMSECIKYQLGEALRGIFKSCTGIQA